MFTYSTFDYSNYVFQQDYAEAPDINLSITTGSSTALLAEINAYLSSDGSTGKAVQYRSQLLEQLSRKNYSLDRFQKDITASMNFTNGGTTYALAMVDLAANTYMANKKANELFTEASRNQVLASETGMTNTGVNLNRLFTTIFKTDDGTALVYSTNESPVTYDTKAITVAGSVLDEDDDVIFITDIPNATGTDRVWKAYNASNEVIYAIRYNSAGANWKIVTVSNNTDGNTVAYSANVDAATITWVAQDESTSAS